MGKLWFDGRCCSDFGIVATGSGTYNAPERDRDIVSVAGRNGDLTFDKGRYKNISVSYPVSICKNFSENARVARNWMLSRIGYKRLEDDYHPETFRMAMFEGPVDFDVKFLNRSGEAKLIFNCKPQRFLKSGEYPVTFSSNGILHNPTMCEALPLITVYGAGAGFINVGGTAVTIKEMTDILILDCESQNAYRQVGEGASQNKNDTIYAPEFPVLSSGDNVVSFSGGVTKVEIVPRWWEL